MKTSCLATLLAPLLQIDVKGKITRFGKNRGGHDAFSVKSNFAHFNAKVASKVRKSIKTLK